MPRGSKPGERRGGRKKGTPNKATRDIREAAQQYTPAALETLNRCLEADDAPWAAKVAASTVLLDRAYGKPTQVVAGDPDAPLVPVLNVGTASKPGLNGNSSQPHAPSPPGNGVSQHRD